MSMPILHTRPLARPQSELWVEFLFLDPSHAKDPARREFGNANAGLAPPEVQSTSLVPEARKPNPTEAGRKLRAVRGNRERKSTDCYSSKHQGIVTFQILTRRCGKADACGRARCALTLGTLGRSLGSYAANLRVNQRVRTTRIDNNALRIPQVAFCTTILFHEPPCNATVVVPPRWFASSRLRYPSTRLRLRVASSCRRPRIPARSSRAIGLGPVLATAAFC
ncbi:hypothetical protein B0I37DRAFT_152551 [Chaetomium sp. MPI-CAGE-AT-0009]|nr:hypothetical protein B0I37DRAFT_152551 [Chaetomium sp. MPI-CAGE-AT-0009]